MEDALVAGHAAGLGPSVVVDVIEVEGLTDRHDEIAYTGHEPVGAACRINGNRRLRKYEDRPHPFFQHHAG